MFPTSFSFHTICLTINAEVGEVVGDIIIMVVNEKLIELRILWKGEHDRIVDSEKTKNAIATWLSNEVMEIDLKLCGAPNDGPISLIFASSYSDSETDKRILEMHLHELLKLFRTNNGIEKVWLKWNDITDDIIWTDEDAQKELNRTLHEKGDYILIHK